MDSKKLGLTSVLLLYLTSTFQVGSGKMNVHALVADVELTVLYIRFTAVAG